MIFPPLEPPIHRLAAIAELRAVVADQATQDHPAWPRRERGHAPRADRGSGKVNALTAHLISGAVNAWAGDQRLPHCSSENSRARADPRRRLVGRAPRLSLIANLFGLGLLGLHVFGDLGHFTARTSGARAGPGRYSRSSLGAWCCGWSRRTAPRAACGTVRRRATTHHARCCARSLSLSLLDRPGY
jgi:hypothetical protein